MERTTSRKASVRHGKPYSTAWGGEKLTSVAQIKFFNCSQKPLSPDNSRRLNGSHSSLNKS